MSTRWDSGWWILGAITAFVIGGTLAICIPIWAANYYSQKASCHSFATQTNRETKFRVLVKVVAPISWDCFTRTTDGKWIPTKNLREFGARP